MTTSSTTTPTQNNAWMNAPEAILETLSSESFAENVERIAGKFGLNEMEAGFLQRITTNLMLGVIRPTDFVTKLLDELDVDREKAAYIAQDVNREIFAPVKDALKEVHKVPPSERPGTEAAPRPITMSRPVGTPSPYVPPPAPVAPPKSILEQKLSGTFVAPPIQSPSAALPTAGNEVVPPPPTQTVPPAPLVPPAPPAPVQTPAELLAQQMFAQSKMSAKLPTPPPPPAKVDPYRETV